MEVARESGFIVFYCRFDSLCTRNWLRDRVVLTAQNNPDLKIKTEIKRCCHPFVRGIYANGNTKTICIKNLTPEEITGYFNDLRNQSGRKVCVSYRLFFVLIQVYR